MILAAIEGVWSRQPHLRFGQVLDQVFPDRDMAAWRDDAILQRFRTRVQEIESQPVQGLGQIEVTE